MATRFQHAPTEFNNSWPFFQVLVMVTVLQRNLGVRYRPDLMEDPVDWSDSRSRFIHGLLSPHGGTCASMPVLYVAIGRRLGWPLYLVGAKQHLFVRWEDAQDRFNIEATSRGLNTHSDQYYREWPLPLSQNEIDGGWYMRNLTPQEEFATFVIDRALCLRDNMQFREACTLGYVAREFAPSDPNFQGFHAIATVMYHAAAGTRRYDFEHDGDKLLRVVESQGAREPEAWEEWAAPIARSEYRRIVSNHPSERSVRPFGGALQRIEESQITD